jgi:hypothetical protein
MLNRELIGKLFPIVDTGTELISQHASLAPARHDSLHRNMMTDG